MMGRKSLKSLSVRMTEATLTKVMLANLLSEVLSQLVFAFMLCDSNQERRMFYIFDDSVYTVNPEGEDPNNDTQNLMTSSGESHSTLLSEIE